MDNVTLPAANASVATDDVGGVHFQRVKIDLGGDGVSLPVSGAMPVTAAALPLPEGAATQATLATVASAIRAEDSVHASGDAGVVMLCMREDSDVPTAANGDYSILKLDEAGRLKVATQPASYPDGAGSITANAQTVFLNVDRASNVTISMVATSLVGHNATFEYSNNSTTGTDGNWYGVQVARSNANTADTATGVLTATPVYGWEVSVNAYKWIRVRATAHTSGTAAYLIKQGTYATEPVPIIQVTGTQPVSGTVTTTPAAGTNLIGDVGLQVRANATGAASIHHMISAATTNAAIVKAGAGRVLGYCFSNLTASWLFVKLHNITTLPTAGTGVVMTIGIPPNGKAECHIGQGVGFATGIGRTIVTGFADADATATTVGAMVGDIFFA